MGSGILGLSFPWSQSGGLSVPGLSVPGLSFPGLSVPGTSVPVTCVLRFYSKPSPRKKVVFKILVFYVKYLWDYLVLMTHGHGFYLLMYHAIFCIHLQGRCNGHGSWTALKGCEDVNNYPSIAFRKEMLNVCFKLF